MISCAVEPLSFPFSTLDPFLFCVYHKDNYPAGDKLMQAPRKGNGADFNPSSPYRMYHGDRVPGFPQHPHRGFETVTATMTGIIDHTDSCGNAGRYGHGDLQWMTAGKGVVHGEMFPLVNSDKPNPLKLFQIWLNLPKKSKMVTPAFAMHWAESIPRFTSPDIKTKVTVWAGEYAGMQGLPPPPDSYGSNPDSELAILLIELQPGGNASLPAARGGRAVNRKAYFIEGSSLRLGLSPQQQHDIPQHSSVTLDASQADTTFTNPHPSAVAEVLILQGKPIGEPVAQQGPFVMNSMAEIRQAYTDYRRTQFGGWPWKEDAMVFPREKGRFALIDGTEIYPPVDFLCGNVVL